MLPVVGWNETKFVLFKASAHPEIKMKQDNEIAWNSFSLYFVLFQTPAARTSWNWNKTKLSTVGWNETAERRQFCFISVLFHDVRRPLGWLVRINNYC